MAFGGPTPGATALKPQQGQNLVAALSSQAAPVNPATKEDRKDPREEQLLNLQRARRALEILRDGVPDGDPLRMLVSALHSAVTKLRDGVQPETVAQLLVTMIAPPPPIMAGGMGMPGLGGPPPPMPVPLSAGMPPGMPVSPGPPG